MTYFITNGPKKIVLPRATYAAEVLTELLLNICPLCNSNRYIGLSTRVYIYIYISSTSVKAKYANDMRHVTVNGVVYMYLCQVLSYSVHSYFVYTDSAHRRDPSRPVSSTLTFSTDKINLTVTVGRCSLGYVNVGSSVAASEVPLPQANRILAHFRSLPCWRLVRPLGWGSLFDMKLEKTAVAVHCRLQADQRSASRSEVPVCLCHEIRNAPACKFDNSARDIFSNRWAFVSL